jgi:hypothetical protein
MAGKSESGGNRDQWFGLTKQRVRYGNLSIIRNGVYERPEDSWIRPRWQERKAKMTEPWNVEDLVISNTGFQVYQYGNNYDREDQTRGGRDITINKYSYRVLFKREHWKDFHIKEIADHGAIRFIELAFKYGGLPEGTNTTKYLLSKDAEVSEQRADFEVGETEDTKSHEVGNKGEEQNKEEEGEILESKGGEGEVEERKEGERESEEGEEREDATGVDTLDEEEAPLTPKPEDFPLAKLFHDTTDKSTLEIRHAFPRITSKTKKGYIWSWPATCAFLCGQPKWVYLTNKAESLRQGGLPLDQWITSHGNQAEYKPARFKSFQDGRGVKWRIQPNSYVFL